MTRLTEKTALLLRPTPPSGTRAPAHLYGSRAAIFHLLRQGSLQEAAARAVSPRPPSSPPRECAAPAPAPPDRGWRAFFQEEDRFEFLPADARGAMSSGRGAGGLRKLAS